MKKILLIEDDPEVRENTAEILELSGYKVLQADNGKEGVRLAQQKSPVLIICDIMMPMFDGYGVLHILNKNPDTSRIPFIFLTAKAEHSDFRKGMNLGADDYLTKPFEEAELLDAVKSRLKKNEWLNKVYKAEAKDLDQFMDDARGLEELKEISKGHQVRHYKKKDNIYWEGDYANALLLVNSGKVKTYKTNGNGKTLITGIYEKEAFIGFNALIRDSHHIDSAMALEHSEVYVIPRHDFFKLLYNNRDVANKFIKILSNNLKEREEQMLHLAYNSVRQRAAEALLALNERTIKIENYKGISITREDLASIVGTAPESVIRALSDFKEEALIDITSNRIKVMNLNKLISVSARGY